MYSYHNNLTARYLGYKKILQKFTERYYWLRIVEDVNQYIQACYQYQIKKPI